jgi:uncharacterized membrane protein YphA (DoxX/SURF4 family)
MKILVNIARILVGGLFIISGLIKLNDPLGFSFKLEEYFSPSVLNLDFLAPYALAIALFLVVFETVLGIALLLGYRSKFTVWSLLLMIVFFTFLTFYSAYFNKVTDCGCFGDAIKLTPWESFTKDVILLIFILILFFGKEYIKPIFANKSTTVITLVSVVLCGLFGNYVLQHLPVKDFRPYKIGANIEEGMTMPDDAPQDIYEYDWKFKVNGEEKIVTTLGEYPTVEGDFIDVDTRLVQEGYRPPIHDFTIEKNGEDMASFMLAEPKLMMVISYDTNKASEEGFLKVSELAREALNKGYKVIGLSSSSKEVTNQLKKEYVLPFDFYFTDQTTLKTIVRSNPGVLLLENGTIKSKVHYNDIKSLDF